MSKVGFTERLRLGRRSLLVEGLEKLVCAECDAEIVPPELHNKNLLMVESAITNAQREISRGMLVKFRRNWGLSQKSASLLIGAGGSSFAKWESGQSAVSGPAVLLIKAALHVPGVTEFLARIAGVELSNQTVEAPFGSSNGQPALSLVRTVGLARKSAHRPIPRKLSVVPKEDWEQIAA